MSELVIGDCRDAMRRWIVDGVRAQMCVTSPPYWGLRDYGTAEWEGGDPPNCTHLAPPRGGISPATSAKQLTSAGTLRYQYTGQCPDCGATRIDRQLGLEPTIAEYVASMVEVFRLVRDVLADDGTLFLNLGDSYYSSPAGKLTPSGISQIGGKRERSPLSSYNTQPKDFGALKPKDLCGIPWRVAFALQADGWYLRQDIIWSKPNPMPESVTDRCTKSHEYLFLLAKRERYYFDQEPIREPISPNWSPDNAPTVNELGSHVLTEGQRKQRRMAYDEPKGANRRSVWTVTTQPYAEAHFATFPVALVEPCIMAGTSQRGHCPACGKGWERVMDRTPAQVMSPASNYGYGAGRNDGGRSMLVGASSTTLGWQPGCECGLEPVPGVVLDPFMGSGTVAQVAQDLGRNWLGCELSPEYAKLIKRRTAQQGLALAAAD